MRLQAGLMVPTVREFELFAVVDVLSDTAHKHDEDTILRAVVGTVRERGTIWDDYLKMFQGIAALPVPILPRFAPFQYTDGHTYFVVNMLEVDHDYYSHGSWMNLDGSTIRLILMESFDGTVDEYQVVLRERNLRPEDPFNTII
jgi:hypothetical protein